MPQSFICPYEGCLLQRLYSKFQGILKKYYNLLHVSSRLLSSDIMLLSNHPSVCFASTFIKNRLFPTWTSYSCYCVSRGLGRSYPCCRNCTHATLMVSSFSLHTSCNASYCLINQDRELSPRVQALITPGLPHCMTSAFSVLVSGSLLIS